MGGRAGFFGVCGALAMLSGALVSGAGQARHDPPPIVRHDPPPIALATLAGRDNFDRYCVACHGTDARGDGPATSGMTPRPRDLTLLSRANGGAFPRDRMTSYIRGSKSGRGHGTTEMPNWGPIFLGLDPSDAREVERLRNVVTYIESLQVASAGAGDPGARLFRAHCASCHGGDATGMGPVAQARHPMPDLTGFALKNGGVFPSARVYRIVEGRDIDAHGSPEMPAWGSVFRRDGANAGVVKARIDAIVKYLGAIQRRTG